MGAFKTASVNPVIYHVIDILAVALQLWIAIIVVNPEVMMQRDKIGSINQSAEVLGVNALADDAVLHGDIAGTARRFEAIPSSQFDGTVVNHDVGVWVSLKGALARTSSVAFTEADVLDDDVV